MILQTCNVKQPQVFPSYEAMSAAAADMVCAQLKVRPDSLFCFASGDTPTLMLRELVKRSKNGIADFSAARFVGLDEWVGMDKGDPGSCKDYLYTNFFDPLKIPARQISYFDAKSKDLQNECEKIDDLIVESGPIDMVVVGVGLNGHIGLNEPGTPVHLGCHVVSLSQSTKDSAQKYFKAETKVDKGITLGFKHIFTAKTVLVIANGKKKAEIIEKIYHHPASAQVPGTFLQQHSNCHFLLEQEAASALLS